jgi:YVTN family beta-propeller protein
MRPRSPGSWLTVSHRHGAVARSRQHLGRIDCGRLATAVMLFVTAGCGSSDGSATSGADAGGRAPALETKADAASPVNGGAVPGEADVDCTPYAYVSNSGSDSVSVIDTTTNKVVATIPTGKAPVNPTFTPDRQHVYVSNSQGGTLTVIDVKTNQTTTIPGGGDRPSGLAFSPDASTLFVSLISQDYSSPGSVVSIKLRTGEVSPPIPMGADPERIALTPDGQRLFVDNLLDGTMAVVDTASSKVVATLMLGSEPFNPLVSPDGTLVYVGVMSAHHIAVIDTKTNQILRTIPADSPNGMTFSVDFQSLFVSNALSGTVQEVSLTTNDVVKTQTVGGLPGNVALGPDGKHVYMVRPEGTTVEVLDSSSLMTVDTITVGMEPSVVAVCRGS